MSQKLTKNPYGQSDFTNNPVLTKQVSSHAYIMIRCPNSCICKQAARFPTFNSFCIG